MIVRYNCQGVFKSCQVVISCCNIRSLSGDCRSYFWLPVRLSVRWLSVLIRRWIYCCHLALKLSGDTSGDYQEVVRHADSPLLFLLL
jgi:hypothetical protein